VPYHQESRSTAQGPILGFAPDTALLRNLAIAIRAGMEAYQGQGSYEPSADELIDVLKNLENLAAANPALYKAIVDQISVCHSKCEDQNQNSVGNQPSHEQQRYAPKQTNGYMEQGCPQVDRHGSHAFVQWQHQQQKLYKLKYPCQCMTKPYGSIECPNAYMDTCDDVDQHGSHGFIRMQQQQQQLNPVVNRIGSIGFVDKQKALASLNRTTIDRDGSLGFVQWQQQQQQLYKQRMNGVAGNKNLKTKYQECPCMSKPYGRTKCPNKNIDRTKSAVVKQGTQKQGTQKQGPQKQGPQSGDQDQQRMMRLQAEADKEVEENKRRLKEQKRKANEPPPPPKTITVMAGSKNRPSWPIAPGIANANQPREITLISGEDELEMEKNRISVAEAAGLKHVDITIGDQADIYGQGFNDSAWSGSLRPTGHKMGKGGKGQDQNDGKSPWAGSLRHVNPNAQKKKKKKEEEDDMYGNAPWMGTLRHVKNVNPVYQSIPFKSKKYPDEDAPNPYESTQGKNAKPVYPLTPAAVIPAGGSSAEATKMRKQNEEVERITSGLRETRSLSGTLLKALMPKLLKEHESKYEPLGHDETFHIMEEILSMQMGLDDDSRVGDEDNDEAEAMIRAITHGEIDNKVYGQMADDLEQAAKMKRKADKPKKKKKKKNANSTSSVSGSELATSASEVSVK